MAKRQVSQAVAEFIATTLAQAPPLSSAQRDRLAELLRPARQRGAA